jgi:hypothetical protein
MKFIHVRVRRLSAVVDLLARLGEYGVDMPNGADMRLLGVFPYFY